VMHSNDDIARAHYIVMHRSSNVARVHCIVMRSSSSVARVHYIVMRSSYIVARVHHLDSRACLLHQRRFAPRTLPSDLCPSSASRLRQRKAAQTT
jgi:hypothetical protein